MDGLGAAPCSDAAPGSARAPPATLRAALTALLRSALLLGLSPSHLTSPHQGDSLLLRSVLPACLPLLRLTPFIPASACVPIQSSIPPQSPCPWCWPRHGSCSSQGDKTAGSHSPTSHDLAELPKMKMGLVPLLGDTGAGPRGWTVQVAEG